MKSIQVKSGVVLSPSAKNTFPDSTSYRINNENKFSD